MALKRRCSGVHVDVDIDCWRYLWKGKAKTKGKTIIILRNSTEKQRLREDFLNNCSAAMLQQIGEWFGSSTSATENKDGSNETAVTNERVVDLKTLIFFGMIIVCLL